MWVVAERDPADPDEMLFGGALVVMSDGSVHSMGSTPDALDVLMGHLGVEPVPTSGGPNAWEREGEGLTLLADLDLAEARELAAWSDAKQTERLERIRKSGTTAPEI